MKKSSVMMIAMALILSSCGTMSRLALSDDGQRFQDGIYANTPEFRSKEERLAGKAAAEELVAKTKESPIYLDGEGNEVADEKNHATTTKYDQSLYDIPVTVIDNPYDWRNNLNPWLFYTPYSFSTYWYWDRHWSPLSWRYMHDPWYYRWSDPWFYRWNDPWYYGWGSSWYAWSDPWYYGGYWGRWYDPWNYWNHWGLYDPWYYGGYWGGYPWYPHYAGWYGGFGPHWGHHHGHGHGPGIGSGGHFSTNRWYGPRNETQRPDRMTASGTSVGSDNRTTVRRGTGTSSSTGRGTVGTSTTSRKQTTTSKSVTGNQPTYRRPAVSSQGQSAGGSSTVTRGGGSSSQSRGTVERQTSTESRSSSSYDRNSSSSYNRSSSSSGRSSSYNSGSSGGGYSRGSTGGGGSYSGGSRGGSGGGRR